MFRLNRLHAYVSQRSSAPLTEVLFIKVHWCIGYAKYIKRELGHIEQDRCEAVNRVK